MSYPALLAAAQSFTEGFAAQYDISVVLDHFALSSDVFALEHGLPELAPFLGRRFEGMDGLKEYFNLLGEHLSYKNMKFKDFVVDPEALKVCCRGEATFTLKATKQSWDEVFTYMLTYDGDCKLKGYEVWADSGAAYLASKGELK